MQRAAVDIQRLCGRRRRIEAPAILPERLQHVVIPTFRVQFPQTLHVRQHKRLRAEAVRRVAQQKLRVVFKKRKHVLGAGRVFADLQQLPRLLFKIVPLFERIKPVGQAGAELKLIGEILQLTEAAAVTGIEERIQGAAADDGKAVRKMLLHFRECLRIVPLRLLRIAAAKCADGKRRAKPAHRLAAQQRAILQLELRQ